ncbi:hypothetical protein E2C01_081089 [Portunus trituberculatus]|uniref:Uncharacterized protein n=1 Tax=Portunus trituberculatus TaxID=210409 RepID=A0A5B7IX29_PORTR|nr:hypothetical protein [Portunus trituberculatus]
MQGDKKTGKQGILGIKERHPYRQKGMQQGRRTGNARNNREFPIQKGWSGPNLPVADTHLADACTGQVTVLLISERVNCVALDGRGWQLISFPYSMSGSIW